MKRGGRERTKRERTILSSMKLILNEWWKRHQYLSMEPNPPSLSLPLKNHRERGERRGEKRGLPPFLSPCALVLSSSRKQSISTLPVSAFFPFFLGGPNPSSHPSLVQHTTTLILHEMTKLPFPLSLSHPFWHFWNWWNFSSIYTWWMEGLPLSGFLLKWVVGDGKKTRTHFGHTWNGASL